MGMNVGILTIKLRLPENMSLKGKRQVVKSVVAQLQNRFKVSAAEVADNDLWQVATVGGAFISNDSRFTNEVLSKAQSLSSVMKILSGRAPCLCLSPTELPGRRFRSLT